MFFVFDGEQFCEAKTLGEAIKEADDAIDCYSDQCDPHWPEEVENICFGVILAHAKQVEHPGEHGAGSTYSYVIDDLYTEAMKAAAEDSHPEKYDYCELVSAIADQGITMLPGLLATVVDTCSRQPVFKDGEAMIRFVRAILERNGKLATAPAIRPQQSEESIRDSCNELAAAFYRRLGYGATEDFKFYETENPRARQAWLMAVEAYEHIANTDVENAVANCNG